MLWLWNNVVPKWCVLPAAWGQTHHRQLTKCLIQVVPAKEIIKKPATLICSFYASLPVVALQNCCAVGALGMLWHTKSFFSFLILHNIWEEENCSWGRRGPHFSLNIGMLYGWSDGGGTKTVPLLTVPSSR